MLHYWKTPLTRNSLFYWCIPLFDENRIREHKLYFYLNLHLGNHGKRFSVRRTGEWRFASRKSLNMLYSIGSSSPVSFSILSLSLPNTTYNLNGWQIYKVMLIYTVLYWTYNPVLHLHLWSLAQCFSNNVKAFT